MKAIEMRLAGVTRNNRSFEASIRGQVSVAQDFAWLGILHSIYYRWKAVYGKRNEDVVLEKIRQLAA